MNNSFVNVLVAIECLKDLGMGKQLISDRIAGWIAKSPYSGDWQDLPPEAQFKLGNAMQKFFEAEFSLKNEGEIAA